VPRLPVPLRTYANARYSTHQGENYTDQQFRQDGGNSEPLQSEAPILPAEAGCNEQGELKYGRHASECRRGKGFSPVACPQPAEDGSPSAMD